MSEPALVLAGGTVVDEAGEQRADVLVGADGVILALGENGNIDAPRTIDATGCVVAPGLVDLHAHLREPGGEEAETIESGTRGAVLGGFTAVVAMPNTIPPIDSASMVRDVQHLAASGLCEVAVAGALTVDMAGERLAPMAEMARAGVRIFSDAGRGVQDGRMMRRAMEYAAGLDVVLAQHCADETLAAGGHMHEGDVSSLLGIPGAPAEAEELMVMRDVTLSRLTGARIHLQQLSTAGSVGIVRAARSQGLDVTAEVVPHHFTLTDEAVAGYDADLKVEPPLRSQDDVEEVRRALADGSIDAIASGHAPHEAHKKELPFDEAPPGMLGLETALALAITELDLSLQQILAMFSWQPAAIAGVQHRHGGPVVPGRLANLAVIDPLETWIVSGRDMASRSRNTPYEGRTLRGRVRHTLVNGVPMVIDGKAQR